MILNDELTIKIEDATFVFEEVTQQDYLSLVDVQKDSAAEGKDKLGRELEYIFSRLVRVEGLFRPNGDAVTVGEDRKLPLPMSLCLKLKADYWQALFAKLGFSKEADAGKDSQGSSDSSSAG